jgi:hypothetical protein
MRRDKKRLLFALDAYYTKAMEKQKRKPGQQPLEPGKKSVVVPVRMKPSQKEKLARLGGGVWVRKRIDREKE